MNTLNGTNFNLKDQSNFYKGKVRDVYSIKEDLMIMVVTDRISAFDCVLNQGIPYKGQVLSQIAENSFKQTEDIVPNWMISCPDPVVMYGHYCDPFKVEMVIRGYLTGHAWREYKSGKRIICGETMPENMNEHDKFPAPIITPTTKSDVGHDEDIPRKEIIDSGLVSEEDYSKLEHYTRLLFQRGTEIAKDRGLILVDTKYEFGKNSNGDIVLIDEIHTPDSSRYFYLDGYEERQSRGEKQKQLSKEFVREWLMENGFQGKDGQIMPDLPDDFVQRVSDRYIELYEKITGNKFEKSDISDINNRVLGNIENIF
tara:strand:- start:1112 stop:2050 length:939 start_codon:yes stop_codon:yes gene_type:complete